MISFSRFIRSLHPLSEPLRDHLEDVVKEKRIARREYLLKAGQICGNIYFVEQGLFRSFYVKEEKEISSGFSREGDICVDFESFLVQSYSQENIQALEDSIVSYLGYDELQRIYRDHLEFDRIARLLHEKCKLLSIQRLRAMWMQRSEDRYDWLVRTYPDLPQRVPGRYLASYLGITEGMLSTIKGKR
jgi:CRP/FNR family transcriptional regulator, anaerobic regulatory protein